MTLKIVQNLHNIEYSFVYSFILFKKKVDYHGPTTVSLSPMTMRKRLLCHARPTGPNLESSSKRRLTIMILPLSLSLQWRCGSAWSVTLTPPGQTRRLKSPIPYCHFSFGDFALPSGKLLKSRWRNAKIRWWNAKFGILYTILDKICNYHWYSLKMQNL